MFKRKLIVFVMILGLGLGAGRAAAAQPVTLEMWGLVESRSYVGTFEAVREFERRNPGVRVEVGTPGGQGDLDPQKLITAVVSRTPPDVIWFGRHNMGLWATRHAFMCLDELIARDGIDLDEYYPGTVGESQWEGKTYALPWNVDCRVLFSNMEILRKHGLDRPPRTWAELEDYARTLTKYNPTQGRYELLGFAPNYGNSWLFLYAWQLGAHFFSPDGRHAQLTSPPVEQALDWMAHMSDVVGGAKKILAFQNSAQLEGIGDPFLSDRIAMQINGNYILDYIARLRPGMDFEVSPPPYPTDQVPQTVSWSGGFSWVIPADARHPQEAWEFIKWMNSQEAWRIQSEAQRDYARREMGPQALFVPFYHANRRINEWLVEQYTADLPQSFRRANQVCLEVLPACEFRPVTPVSGELWDAQQNAILDATDHIRSVKETLAVQQSRVQSALDRFYAPPTGRTVQAGTLTASVALVVAAMLAVAAFLFVRVLRRDYKGLERRRALTGVCYILPWLVGFVGLVIGPMLYSLVISFTQYDVISPARWNGLDNWVRMFGAARSGQSWVPNDPQMWRSLGNTFYIVLVGVPVGMIVSLGIALLLNTKIRGMSLYRTLYYVPVIVPAVASAFIFVWLLNPETGFLNVMLNPWLARVGLHAPPWFTDAKWAKPGLILLLTWGCGGTVIVWLAGIQSLPTHLYEAAMIDGATPAQRLRHVTLPLLTPYVLFIWIMGTIASLQIFTQAYLIGAPGDALLFYVLYLFFRAFRYFEMGYACAMAWVLFLITVSVCLWQLHVSRKYVHYESEA